jgi:hypothetical protein
MQGNLEHRAADPAAGMDDRQMPFSQIESNRRPRIGGTALRGASIEVQYAGVSLLSPHLMGGWGFEDTVLGQGSLLCWPVSTRRWRSFYIMGGGLSCLNQAGQAPSWRALSASTTSIVS